MNWVWNIGFVISTKTILGVILPPIFSLDISRIEMLKQGENIP